MSAPANNSGREPVARQTWKCKCGIWNPGYEDKCACSASRPADTVTLPNTVPNQAPQAVFPPPAAMLTERSAGERARIKQEYETWSRVRQTQKTALERVTWIIRERGRLERRLEALQKQWRAEALEDEYYDRVYAAFIEEYGE